MEKRHYYPVKNCIGDILFILSQHFEEIESYNTRSTQYEATEFGDVVTGRIVAVDFDGISDFLSSVNVKNQPEAIKNAIKWYFELKQKSFLTYPEWEKQKKVVKAIRPTFYG